jgi:hypothetical protein
MPGDLKAPGLKIERAMRVHANRGSGSLCSERLRQDLDLVDPAQVSVTVHLIDSPRGGFTNEVQHVEFLSLAVARLASPVVHCFMIGAAVKGDPQERGARAHP